MSPITSQRSVWGKWTLNPDNGCLETDNGAYQIPVDEMLDSASILDWIFQISEKTWATSEVVGDLVKAISDILGRGVCGGGINNPIDPKPSLRRYGVKI
jgi:hypothetical protein